MNAIFFDRKYDATCLADGYVEPADFSITGINQNELIVGTSGAGKTFSVVYPRLLHTYNCSVVVPITKKKVKVQFEDIFKSRGYEVIEIDMINPFESSFGYDPMDFVNTDEDVIQLARNIMSDVAKGNVHDSYWSESAINVLAALIALERLNAKADSRRPSLANVIEIKQSMIIQDVNQRMNCNLDCLFEEAGFQYPGNIATRLWNTIKGLSSITASCIISFLSTALDKISTASVMQLYKKENRISFSRLGENKTICFISTSPVNKSLQGLLNIMYADLFRVLYESAEQKETMRLDIPVHIICDDFACGGRIKDFEEYISVFRATGISVTILLQSESQLASMYGEMEATTIINNCDTYVYMGGTDIDTCKNISSRVDKPLHKVLSMPLEQVMVFRRGAEPIVARRYQTLEDSVYLEEIDRRRSNVV